MRLCGPAAQDAGGSSCLATPTTGQGHLPVLEPGRHAHALQILNMLISLAIQFSEALWDMCVCAGEEVSTGVCMCLYVCVVGLEVLRQQLFRRLNCAKSENLTKSYFICEQGRTRGDCVGGRVTGTATIAVGVGGGGGCARVKHI